MAYGLASGICPIAVPHFHASHPACSVGPQRTKQVPGARGHYLRGGCSVSNYARSFCAKNVWADGGGEGVAYPYVVSLGEVKHGIGIKVDSSFHPGTLQDAHATPACGYGASQAQDSLNRCARFLDGYP